MTYKENTNHSLNLNNRIRKNCRSKIVQKIDSNTKKIIKEYVSIYRASIDNEISWQTIYDRCSGKYNQTGNYIWKFKESL